MSRLTILVCVNAPFLVASMAIGDGPQPIVGGISVRDGSEFDMSEVAGVSETGLAAHALDNRRAAARIRARLARRVAIRFQETPLNEAIRQIGAMTGEVQIQIDEAGLRDYGIGLESPVTVSASHATIAQVLHRVLAPHGLAWQVEDGTLQVTLRIKADERMTARVYNVARLAGAICAEQAARDGEQIPVGAEGGGRKQPGRRATMIRLFVWRVERRWRFERSVRASVSTMR